MRRSMVTDVNGPPGPLKAIVVNDDPTQRKIMSELLRKSGLHVREFDTAEAALLALDPNAPPAIIVTDLYMPGIDGWRFCRLLRSPEYRAFNRIPVMVVSATFAGEEADRITADSGANAFLPCPVDGKRFIEEVEALLEGKTRARRLAVLIVEDSRTQAIILQKAFISHGYDVHVAHSGSEARDLFRGKRFEIVVLDYHLPDVKGNELLNHFRADAPHVGFIMMTADPDPHLAVEWMKQGVSAYIRKPFDPEYLITLCENARRERALLHVEELLEDRTRALQDAEAQYRTVVENQTDLVCRWKPDTTLTFVNEAYCRYFQMNREELVGMRFLDLVPEKARREIRQMKTLFMDFPEPRTAEIQIVTMDGKVRWLHSIETPLLDEKGRVREVLSVARDVTERKEAENVLRHRAELERIVSRLSSSFVQPGDLGVKISDALASIGAFIGADRAYLFQIRDEEQTADNTYEWCAPGVEPQIKKLKGLMARKELPHFWECMEKGETYHISDVDALPDEAFREKEHFTAQGIQSLVVVPILGEQKLMGFLGFDAVCSARIWPDDSVYLLQLTAEVIGRTLERRRAEEALRDSEARLQLVLQGANLGMWDWNIETGDVVFNDRWAAMLGYWLDELTLNVDTLRKLKHPEDVPKVMMQLKAHLKGESPFYESEYRLRAKNGEWRWVLDRGKVIERDGSGRALRAAGTQLDITQRKANETERFDLERQLQQTQKRESLNLMAGGIAHHFNNLLTAVLSSIEVAKSSMPSNVVAEQALKGAENAAKRAADMSRLLRTYVGQGRRQKVVIDLGEHVREIVPLIRSSITPNIKLEVEVSAAPLWIEADPGEIHQVLMNLATNAWESIGDSEGLISITAQKAIFNEDFLKRNVTGDELSAGQYVCLRVIDNGAGMDSETKGKMFDPFFSTKFAGRGLGLAVTLGIVRGCRGAIFVSGRPGRGCRFEILFPVRELPVVIKAEEPQSLPEDAETGTVLIVDDDEMLLTAVTAMLQVLGFNVVAAADGVEAVALFRERKDEISCVLLDLTMPEMDGWETLTALRQLDPKACVILSTGYDVGELQEENRDVRPDGWVQKPYQLPQLRRELERCMHRKKE